MSVLTKKGAVDTVGQRRLSALIVGYHDRVAADFEVELDESSVEYILGELDSTDNENSYYVPTTDLGKFVASSAGIFLSKGAKSLGTATASFRAGDPDIALLGYYNAALFFARATSAMLGVMHFDYAVGDKRVQCLVDLFPALDRKEAIKEIESTKGDIGLSARITFANAKWEHADIYTTFDRLLLATTRWESGASIVGDLRKMKYRDASGIRNGLVYGRGDLPFGFGNVYRYTLLSAFRSPWAFGDLPLKNIDPAGPLNLAWMQFSLSRWLCEEFGGEKSALGREWQTYLYGGQAETEFVDFYWRSNEAQASLEVA